MLQVLNMISRPSIIVLVYVGRGSNTISWMFPQRIYLILDTKPLKHIILERCYDEIVVKCYIEKVWKAM